MLRIFHHWRRTRDGGFWIDQLSRAVSLTTRVTVVAVLVFRFTFRASAFYETIRQEHLFFRIEQLRNGAA
ncbi:Uncharacterised protein [Vibrio cholerae]|nr:Uncharacterised protein [Vibrio cholerae]CSD00069.1 Uncharacterised protein [Vibrio cholerae]